ncbi:unnamed protein product [Musa acuminata var. zebrina]
MIASHVLGASWYLLSVERQRTCWKSQCTLDRPLCKLRFLIVACQANRNVKAGLLVKKYFYRYAFYLSSAPVAKHRQRVLLLGRHLFSILIVLVGLVLFAHLIGNMQVLCGHLLSLLLALCSK